MAESPPIEVPLINGVAYSFAHILLNINGVEFTGGFKEINYNRKRNRTMVRSNSPDPVAKTIGDNEYTCSASIYLSQFSALIQFIGDGYGDAQFPIFVSYEAPGFGVITDQIINCTIDSSEASQSAGPDALTRTIDFSPTKILFGGLEDLENPLVAPPQ